MKRRIVDRGRLAREEHFLSAIVQHLQESVIMVDIAGVVTYWSGGAERMFGWSSGEALGRSVFELIRPDMSAEERERHRAKVLASDVYRETALRRRKDGSRFPVDSTYVTLRDPAGEPLGVIGVARDVTEQVAARRSLEASEAELRAVIDSMSDSVIVRDATRAVVMMNDAAPAVFGLTSTQLRGDEALPSGWSLYQSDGETPLTECLDDEVRRTKERVAGRRGVIRMPDGTTKWTSSNAVPLRDADASIRAVVVSTRDVTAEREDEQRRIDEARLRGLAERMNEAEFVLKRDGAFVHVNDRAVAAYGYTHDEFLGLNIRDVRHPSRLATLEPDMVRAESEGIRFESLHVRKDGSTFPVEVSSRSFTVAGTVYVHSVIRDLTEEMKAREQHVQLVHLEERLRSILTAMAEGVVMHDTTGRIVFCNDAAERILGLTRGQMEGRTSVDPRWRAIRVDESPFPGDEHPAMVTLRTGEPQRNVLMGVQLPTGERNWISICSEPLRHAAGEAPYAVIATFADVTALRRTVVSNEALVAELREALAKVKTLSGLLPICMFCHKIRNDQGYWEQLERYIGAHSDAQFSHGLCEECQKKHYPDGDPERWG